MADNSKRLGGIARFTIDGTGYLLVGDLKYSTSIVERESMMGMDTYHGYSEKRVPGFMEMTVRDTSQVTTRSFNDMVDVSVIAQTANGKSVAGQNMVCMKAIEVDTAEGKFTLRFEGPDVNESKGAGL